MGTKDGIREWAVRRIVALLKPEARTLDLGCGDAASTLSLREKGVAIECADVDRWHDEIEGLHHTPGADLTGRLPFEDDSFDAVASFEVFEHLTNPFHAVSEYARILRPDGQLFLTIPNFWSLQARWRFLWTGAINRSKVRDEGARANLREGRCPPHINTLPWPTLKYGFAAYGFQLEEIAGHRRTSVLGVAWLLPLGLLIALLTLLTKGRRFESHETNLWSVLTGSHIFLYLRKVGVEAVDGALARGH